MQEQEYEVDLRDYLKVIWERKWIILGVFVVAIAAAAVFSFNLPDEYEVSALLRLESNPFVIRFSPDQETNGVQPQLPTAQTVSQLIQQKGLWQRSLQLLPREGVWQEQRPDSLAESLAAGLRVEVWGDSSFLFLRLKGALPADELNRMLIQHIATVQELLKEEIQKEIEQQLMFIDQQEEYYMRRRTELTDELNRWIERRIQSLQQQKTTLLEQFEELVKAQTTTDVQNPVIQSSILQQSYAALSTQLRVIEEEMTRLETEKGSQFPRPGSGLDAQLSGIDLLLLQLGLRKNSSQELLARNWVPLRTVSELQASPVPVGPNRKLNIAIAAVLGLFVGLLLAFFVHYLQSTPSPSQLAGQMPADRPGSA